MYIVYVLVCIVRVSPKTECKSGHFSGRKPQTNLKNKQKLSESINCKVSNIKHFPFYKFFIYLFVNNYKEYKIIFSLIDF